MKIVVLKFGGTSVGTIGKIKKIAEIIKNYKKKNYRVIVVSSAMSGVTNELVKKSKEISGNFSNSEYDVLVSSGEQVACSLIAGRLIHYGLKSRSWLSWQIPILTEGEYKNSRINSVNKNNVHVIGDNIEFSEDSNKFGLINNEKIIGIVTSKLIIPKLKDFLIQKNKSTSLNPK